MDEIEELKKQNESLKETIHSMAMEFWNFFDDKPDENGYYIHLGICSGSRSKPIGAYGCCCKNAAVFKRMRNPHDFILTGKTRIPERGLNWDSYECSKCHWTGTYNPDMDVNELNKQGWCPISKDTE